MRLVLFRHGIAIDREDPDCPPDAERPLTKEGEHLTRQAALGLKAMKVAPDLILTSPLLRAVQTARIAADALEIRKSRVVTSEHLSPSKSPGDLLESLSEWGAAEILAVGHAPHLDQTIARAVGVSIGAFTSLKKAGAALLDLRDEGSRSEARLDWILPAGTLRRLAKSR